MSPNDADGMANSVDPDQTATLGVQIFLDSYGNTVKYRKNPTNSDTRKICCNRPKS